MPSIPRLSAEKSRSDLLILNFNLIFGVIQRNIWMKKVFMIKIKSRVNFNIAFDDV